MAILPEFRWARDLLREIPFSDLPAAALREVFKEGYSRSDFKQDLMSGLVVGVVALPLSMALSIAVGAPPQQGLYTAIVAGFIAALLGGSRVQVTGPTAAFIVILAPIFSKFGLGGLLIAGVLGGLILLLMAFLRFGRMLQFIPHPVTTGFTAGIATVIATRQLKDLFGIQMPSNPEHYFDWVEVLFASRGTASLLELIIGLFTLVLLLLLPKVAKKVPAPLLALPLAAILALSFRVFFPDTSLATISSRFETIINGDAIRGIPQLPPLPFWPWDAPGADGRPLGLSLALLRELLPHAFAIAMLGAIESLLSAVVADGLAGTRHNPDAELFGQGVANIIAPFFGGIPATGALARTATNVRSGARSPIAAMIHSLVVLSAVLILAPLIGYLPMSALAGLLLLVAWNMSDIKHFTHILKAAPKSDITVLLVCYGLTVAFDMVISISVGVVLAALLFMRRMAEVSLTQLIDSDSEMASLPGVKLLAAIPKDTILYDIHGPLFFGAAHKAMETLHHVSRRAKVVILRVEEVPAIDATGLMAIESTLIKLRSLGCFTIIEGLRPQPQSVLQKAHIEESESLAFRPDLENALALASEYIKTHATGGYPLTPDTKNK
jgi:sulfate permease, SulP family